MERAQIRAMKAVSFVMVSLLVMSGCSGKPPGTHGETTGGSGEGDGGSPGTGGSKSTGGASGTTGGASGSTGGASGTTGGASGSTGGTPGVDAGAVDASAAGGNTGSPAGWYEAEAIPPNVLSGSTLVVNPPKPRVAHCKSTCPDPAAIKPGDDCCSGGGEVTWLTQGVGPIPGGLF